MKSNSKAKAKLEGERLLYLNDKEKKCKIRIAAYKEKCTQEDEESETVGLLSHCLSQPP